MDALFGSSMPLAARFFIAFLVVLALIGLTAWLVRRFGTNRLGSTSRGRQPRLAVIDAASVDGRRRLVLIRRDNIEHLLMIGGPTDVVIEPNIVRASGAREMAREPGRLAMPPEALARPAPIPASMPTPVPEPSPPTSWQPPANEPPPPPSRPPRAPASEEPWLPSEAGARPHPTDSLTDLAATLSSKFNVSEPAAPPHLREPAPPRSSSPPTSPEPAPQNDHSLAEMAQQLEAALRRPPSSETHPPVTDALAVTPPSKPAPPRPATHDIKPRFETKFEPKVEPKRQARFEPKFEPKPESKPEPTLETKFEPPRERRSENKSDNEPENKAEAKSEPKPEEPPDKNLYDNLEQEMASLLGRPLDKS